MAASDGEAGYAFLAAAIRLACKKPTGPKTARADPESGARGADRDFRLALDAAVRRRLDFGQQVADVSLVRMPPGSTHFMLDVMRSDDRGDTAPAEYAMLMRIS